MKVTGFDSLIMRRVFESFLSDVVTKNGKRGLLNTRLVSLHGEGNNPNLTLSEMKKENIQFQNDMAFLYIKTFFGRSPRNFKTFEYKMESERFNLYIKNSRYPHDLEERIARCIRRNGVDYVQGELPYDLFYERLKFGGVGLYTDDIDHRLFITPNFATHARVYINPSMKDYRHIVMFIMEHVAHRELGVGFKTRMDKIRTTNALNNLILYTSAKDFPALIEILNMYAKMYPEKVLDFGDTVATLGRAKNDWFGFGFEPQRSNTENMGLTTFNTAIDDMFNNYVLTASMLDDFNEITSRLQFKDVVKIFLESGVAHKEDTAREMAMSLYDSKLTAQVINNFCNLSHVRNTSLVINKVNEKIPEKKRRGMSPSQIRNDKDKPSDITLLKNQLIEFPLYNGGLVMVSRKTLAQLLQHPKLRDCMLRFYNNSEETDKQVAQMAWLWNYLGKFLPYLNSGCPFLSDDLVNSIKAKLPKANFATDKKYKKKQQLIKKVMDKEKEHIKTIKLLCSDKITLVSSLTQLRDMHHTDLKRLNKEDLQKKIIMTIGLDKVIDSYEFFKAQQKDSSELYQFQNALMELREERGLQLIEQLKETKTKRERELIASQLSRFAREDITREYQNEKAMEKFDDFIRSLYY